MTAVAQLPTLTHADLRRVSDERHYTPQELAELWGLSARFIRELFEEEPGVLKIARPEKMHKRRYCTIRIPMSVARSVHARLHR